MIREASSNLSALTLYGNFDCSTIEHIALHRLNESMHPILGNMDILGRNLEEIVQSSRSQIGQSNPQLHDSLDRLQSITQSAIDDLNDLAEALWDF